MPPDSENIQRRIHAVEASRGHEPGESPKVALQYSLTDQGNGMRLAAQHGEDLRYVADNKKWYVWDGTRWLIDNTGEVMRRAKQVAVDIADDSAVSVKQVEVDKWAKDSQSSGSLEAMIRLARSEYPIPATPEMFDKDPWLWNCPGGTINLLTGEHYTPRREDLLMKQGGARFVKPDPDNSESLCPTWLTFLSRIMDDDEEMIQFLQRCVGYSMTGTVKERVLLILYGSGANGKSTFIEVLHAMFGDYATVTPVDTLLAKKFASSIPNDIAALKGVRFVSAAETEENAKLATGKVKTMTGGGTLVARFMGGEFFKFQSTFKLWLETNHKPAIRDSSPAMFDRIRLVPFKVRIPENDRDKNLKEKLLAELPGIQNWALAGLKQYLEIGLAAPAKVLDETARYQKDQDVLGNYISERCVESGSVNKDDFYRDYVTWCKEGGEYLISKNTLGRRMNDRGIEEQRSGKERRWLGVSLKFEAPGLKEVPGNATHLPASFLDEEE